jgi:hypothetical protein
VVNRFEQSVKYTCEWAGTILEEFGGQPFSADDTHLLMF